MKMNTKVRYGLRAMLVICNNKSSKGVLQKEIAAQEKIPIKYLDAIISGLKQAGLLMNYAGKGSGYVLTREAKDISVYEVYRAFEPPIALANCSYPSCTQKSTCNARFFWTDTEKMITDWMTSSTLDKMITN